MSTSGRRFQIVVWGASGFVGKLVCERIATEYPNQLRMALIGRSQSKLETVRAEMTKHDPSCKAQPLTFLRECTKYVIYQDLEIMLADADDRPAIDAIVKSTEVVISCAGPYRKYSSTMVESCVANGTHYLDMSGEVPWIRNNIRAYHAEAAKNRVKIVHFCGIGSVPIDLGTLLVVQTIRHRYQTGCRLVEVFHEEAKGGVSGGSAISLLDFHALATEADRQAMDEDPYQFTPQHLDVRSGKGYDGVHYNSDLKAYMAPFVLTKTDTAVVHRSNALAREPYGLHFDYREGLMTSNLLVAWFQQLSTTIFNWMVETYFGRGITPRYSTFRSTIRCLILGLLSMALPKPGEGPNLKLQREEGFWRMKLIGYPEDPKAKHVCLKLADNHGDPGYWSTSKMLLECALSLVLEKERVDEAASLKGGVLTPALAFGSVPLERLKNRGGFVVDLLL